MYTTRMKAPIETKRPGRKFENPFLIAQLKDLKKGQSTTISRDDWPLKTRPGRYVLRRLTGGEFDSRTLADDTGWFVTAL